MQIKKRASSGDRKRAASKSVSKHKRASRTGSTRLRGRPTAELGEQRLQFLYQRAFKHFMLHGVRGANIKAIAREAGVTRQMIHSRFGTKKGFFQAVMRETKIELFDYIRFDETTDASQPDQVLAKAANSMLATLMAEEYLEFARALYGGLHQHKLLVTEYAALLERTEAPLVQYLVRAAQQQGIKIASPVHAIRHFMALVVGLYMPVVLGIRDLTEQERPELVREIVELFLRGLGFDLAPQTRRRAR